MTADANRLGAMITQAIDYYWRSRQKLSLYMYMYMGIYFGRRIQIIRKISVLHMLAIAF